MAQKQKYADHRDALLLELARNNDNAEQAGKALGLCERTARKWRKKLRAEFPANAAIASPLTKIAAAVAALPKKIKHLVIPDVQVKPGQCNRFLERIGQYIVDKLPDVIICIGDFADMPSLGCYDKGKRSFEGRRYKKDVQATVEAMEALFRPINAYNAKQRALGLAEYKPRWVLTLGNHEYRIVRVTNDSPELDGAIGIEDLQYERFGWEVHDFLKVVTIDGVNYSHYFTGGVMGRPVSSARALLNKKHQSCVMGHVQTDQIVTDWRADGSRITGLFVGCCYEHNEDYLGPQGNNYWRGIWMLHEVKDGSFEPMQVSLNYLKDRYQ